MSIEQNLIKKFYYPMCNGKDCNGITKIKINEYDFTVDYECENNESHNGKGIFFETFEKFYLKEKIIEKCFKCNLNLENNYIYKCKKCNQKYCSFCFITDEHIKKNIDNLIINSNKCKIHQRELVNYCVDCKKKVCLLCLNSDQLDHSNSHKYHKIVYIYNFMPSNNQFDYLKEKINQKTQ